LGDFTFLLSISQSFAELIFDQRPDFSQIVKWFRWDFRWAECESLRWKERSNYRLRPKWSRTDL